MPSCLTYCLLLLTLILKLPAYAQAPDCSMQINGSLKGCAPHSINFDVKITGSQGVSSYSWDFGDGNKSVQQSTYHIYSKPGKYVVYLTVLFADGTLCKKSSSVIQIFDSPTADFDMTDYQQIILCKRGQSVCFKDLSKPGKENTPLKSWTWDFGDGGVSTLKNPCYAYSDSGYYQVVMEVTDTNGCVGRAMRMVHVVYASDVGIALKPKFRMRLYFDCKNMTARAFFDNLTDTPGNYITKFKWNYGDGDYDSCNMANDSCRKKKWTGLSHPYFNTGIYSASLTVWNKFGCTSTYVLDTPIQIIPYKFFLNIHPDTIICYAQDSSVTFETPGHPNASYYIWEFGDPRDSSWGRTPIINHTYPAPGVYTIRYRTKISNCLIDTILCKKVKFVGPIALIQQKPLKYQPWDSAPPNKTWLIPNSSYPDYFRDCPGAPDVVPYYKYTTTIIPNGDTIFSYCKADTVGYKTDTTLDCYKHQVAHKTPVLKPKILKVRNDTLTKGTRLFWTKGDPYPSGPVYSKPPFKNDPLRMDDTTLFSLRCKGPMKVKFTNFSRKYRGYDAVDNNPPGFPDTCINPAYPFASDSLMFRWVFKEGDNTISTSSNPNVRSSSSYERTPTHLFQKDGCYMVRLYVTDPKTGCTDQDSIPVVMQEADAGWGPEYSSISNMTYDLQQTLPKGYPRRGLILSGRPCVNDTQHINLSETLPSCYKRSFSMIFDSAAATFKDQCSGKINWVWKGKSYVNDTLQYIKRYQDTGFKTLGLVVINNQYCKDTVWYHNYKYIHGLYPGLILLKKQLCVGETLKLPLEVPEQPGIKLFTVKYVVEADRGDTLAVYGPDTIRYRVVKNGTKKDTITSTVHRKDWGIDDGALNFSYLYDTIKRIMPIAGHVKMITHIYNRWGCRDSSIQEITVGEYRDFDAEKLVLCPGDTAKLHAAIAYYLPLGKTGYGYDQTDYWADPVGARKGRTPKIPELAQWDVTGDSVPDISGEHTSYVFQKPGIYSVRLFTRDSLGCAYTMVKKDYLRVIDIKARFGVDTPGPVAYCGSHFFVFKDSSFVIDLIKDTSKRMKVAAWTWDFGDGSPPITVTDPAKRSPAHFYTRNGKYTVTLTVRTSLSTGTGGTGCQSTFSRPVQIIGPYSDFEPIGPLEGCVPLTVMMRDKSKDARVREWRLGDNTVKSSGGQDTVYLTYTKPGTFCPEFYVADSIVTLNGKKRYCSDYWPQPACKYKVIVHDSNIISLTADTLVCVDDPVSITGTPDTGYKSWTIDFGDGVKASGSKPKFQYHYALPGKYRMTLSGKGAFCPDTARLNVRVIDVKADFYLDSSRRDTPVFTFVNTSQRASRYVWHFDDGSPDFVTKKLIPVSHEFQRTGKINVCLVAYNEKNCPDSFCRTVEINTYLDIPNIFTANGDAANNEFVVDIRGERFFELKIYNRWGEKVFESHSKYNTWKGTDPKGDPYPDGTYYFVFNYRFIGGENKSVAGTVTLVR